ncbi:MAG: DUF494 family protein [Ignavibacteriae bacterium]|nr:DUF494 family protein [Ignavibacteriota bacterium]NOG96576.1 DUF494 family protein [Ignavibacteriota bacterium]
MTEKIVEVLAEILERLNKNSTLEEVNTILSKNKKFDEQTLSAAFSLVFDKVLAQRISSSKKYNKANSNFRLLTEEEKEVIGIDNYNYILHLYNVGLLDYLDFEMILEQIMMFPAESITKDDINWTIFISLVDFNAEILPGSRLLLYSSDNIN